MKNNDLNNILKDWDRNLKPQFKDAAEVKRNIISQLKPRPPLTLNTKEYFFIRKKYVYNLAAAASVCFIAAGIFILNLKASKPSTGIAQLAMLSNDEISDVKKITGEVCKLFNDKVDWIIRSGDKMEIKPSEFSDNSNLKSKILVRQTVFRKTDKGWDKVYIADIITSPDQQVVFK